MDMNIFYLLRTSMYTLVDIDSRVFGLDSAVVKDQVAASYRSIVVSRSRACMDGWGEHFGHLLCYLPPKYYYIAFTILLLLLL